PPVNKMDGLRPSLAKCGVLPKRGLFQNVGYSSKKRGTSKCGVLIFFVHKFVNLKNYHYLCNVKLLI
ncbi:MAG: hypothetical protein Q4C37_10335, partial [Bacteroidales bacterium]|nr:hypothetical protein [Bacteroidales bacterium]